MPIHVPGKRDRKHRGVSSGARSAYASLSLTPMVDMFTILVVFLLQNYSATGEIIYIPKDVVLPKASQTKDLKPAHVVTLTKTEVVLDTEPVAQLEAVKAQTDWLVHGLYERLQQVLKADKEKAKNDLKATVSSALPPSARPEQTVDESAGKITVQADKEMDFLTIKKIMFTITEAGSAESGGTEINFAVTQKEKTQVPPTVTN